MQCEFAYINYVNEGSGIDDFWDVLQDNVEHKISRNLLKIIVFTLARNVEKFKPMYGNHLATKQ